MGNKRVIFIRSEGGMKLFFRSFWTPQYFPFEIDLWVKDKMKAKIYDNEEDILSDIKRIDEVKKNFKTFKMPDDLVLDWYDHQKKNKS